MLTDDMESFVLLLAAITALLLFPDIGAGQIVDYSNGEYTLSTPATSRQPRAKLAPEVGRPIVERLLKPEHMVLTGLGERGEAVLRVGDDTREALYAQLGAATRLPDWRKSHFELGFASARPGDSTVVVVQLGLPDLEPPDHITSVSVYFSPAALPKDYRPHLKRFVPSAGVHAGLSTQSGLRLGLSRQEVEAILGAPIWKEKDAYYYGVVADMILPAEFLITRWKWPKDVKDKPGAIQQFIDVWFVGGRVSAFQVRKLYDM